MSGLGVGKLNGRRTAERSGFWEKALNGIFWNTDKLVDEGEIGGKT